MIICFSPSPPFFSKDDLIYIIGGRVGEILILQRSLVFINSGLASAGSFSLMVFI